MNIFEVVKKELLGCIEALGAENGWDFSSFDPARITVEPPRDASHGDMASNAAMVLAKPAGLKPRDLAQSVADALMTKEDLVASVDIAGPGFLNIKLKAQAWFNELSDILTHGTAYGTSQMGGGKSVNVEFVSANPTGPIHFGHTRNAVLGDALASLLEKAGYDVCREYYVNDGGAQIETLARSAYIRYREALGEAIDEIPEGLYPGEYLKPIGQALADEFGDQFADKNESEWLETFSERSVAAMLKLIKENLKLLNINFDVFTSEKALSDAGKVDEAVAALDAQGLVYTGTLPPPKSSKVNLDEWKPQELLLFRSTEFGDDQDRPLKKGDGTWAYVTPDIAYEYDKFQRGFEQLLVVVAVDHAGWVKRLTAGTKAVTKGKADVGVLLYGLVNLMKGGKPFKLSKRAGNILTLEEIVNEVGAGVVRFIMLTRKAQEMLDFDLANAVDQSKDNPFFYVQYAHARCCSVLRHGVEAYSADQVSDAALSKVDCSSLVSEDELSVLRLIASWPRLVEQAASAQEPHRVAFFLQEVAAAFHSWWNKGRDDVSMRFLVEGNDELSMARLALVRAVAVVLASGLDVIGIEAMEELRASVEIEAA